MTTAVDVQGLYEELNQTFFDGKLPRCDGEELKPPFFKGKPHCTISLKSRAEMPPETLGSTKLNGGYPSIWIRRDALIRAKGRIVLATLLHEMIHVKLGVNGFSMPDEAWEKYKTTGQCFGGWDHFTREFQAELARLAARGQVWAARELKDFRALSQFRAEWLTKRGLPLDRWCGDLFDGRPDAPAPV